ncbi:MAG: NAD(P)/FAD-dependent oxidoreductase [bacterium]|nr:NAD(P)/FAD-dependent oxidoreductase [bacterium]
MKAKALSKDTAGSRPFDACIVGSGPNGLAAAALLAQKGARVLVLEARESAGGGMRTEELTLPGFAHDICSAAHPMGVLSPFLATLPLAAHGLEWRTGDHSAAHPLDGEPAVLLRKSVVETAAGLDAGDERAYAKLLEPLLKYPAGLLADALGPLTKIPRHPILMARFGLLGIRSASALARSRFRGERARALLAGCAAHSVLPLSHRLTSALGLMFLITGHMSDWPVARGGSIAIARALIAYIESLGGEIRVSSPVRTLADVPPARVILFDTSPEQLVAIAGDELPTLYKRRLGRYRYGPGVFKLDLALDGPIPWSDPAVNRASTVHVGGRLGEIAAAEAAMWRGEHPEQPFVMVVQQSELDEERAPRGKHTGYAYCHVPAGSTVDMTDAIEKQIERFAPGFRDRILARHKMYAGDLQKHNANYIGGAITGGVADLPQAFLRPIARWNPYATPNPRIFLCSSATPPGGGVHGMCGYYAGLSAARRLGLDPEPAF